MRTATSTGRSGKPDRMVHRAWHPSAVRGLPVVQNAVPEPCGATRPRHIHGKTDRWLYPGDHLWRASANALHQAACCVQTVLMMRDQILRSHLAGRGCLLDPPDVAFRRVKSLDHAIGPPQRGHIWLAERRWTAVKRQGRNQYESRGNRPWRYGLGSGKEPDRQRL